MSEQHPLQEPNPAQIANNLRKTPLAYGLEFEWGGFAVTEAADDFYGLQVNSLDARKPSEQFQEIPAVTPQKIIRPRIMLAAPHELPALAKPSQPEQSIRIASYSMDDEPLSIWLTHSMTPEERRRKLWQSCIDLARQQLDDPSISDEQLSRVIAYGEPGKLLALNDITPGHAARLQLSEMVDIMVDRLPAIVTSTAARRQEKQYSRIVRQTGARLIASTAAMGYGSAMLVPGESMIMTATKVMLPIGALAVGGALASRMQGKFNRTLIENTVSGMGFWQAYSNKVGNDIEATYSGEGFNEQIRKMLGEEN